MESLKEVGQVSDIEETVTGSVRLRALKVSLLILMSHVLLSNFDILFSNFDIGCAALSSFSYQNELVTHQMLNQVQMLMILDPLWLLKMLNILVWPQFERK